MSEVLTTPGTLATAKCVCSLGHENPESAHFCTMCGEPLIRPEASQLTTTNVELESNNQSITEPPAILHNIPADPSQLKFSPQTYSQVQQPQPRVSDTHCCCCGRQFGKGEFVCTQCLMIKPIADNHTVDPALFQWAQDGKAMAKLRSIGPLMSFARSVSERVGRRWIEATFNGVRLGYNQMPHIYAMAVQSARILNLKKMPVVYVSGVRPWDALTFGSDEDAFIVIGSALVSSFRKSELMFLFAREMGHIVAGHALWKTVIQFMVGEQNPRQGMMKNGVAGLLDPGKWIEGAIELPLLGWARQSEITADRAGLLAAKSLPEARKVLLSWSLKSPLLYRQINEQAWLEQQAEDAADENIRLAEMVSSSIPYITRRLKLLDEFEHCPEVSHFRRALMASINSANVNASESDAKQIDSNCIDLKRTHSKKFKCPKCGQALAMPTTKQKGQDRLAIRCANKSCKRITVLGLKPQSVNADSKTSQHRKQKRAERESFQAAE